MEDAPTDGWAVSAPEDFELAGSNEARVAISSGVSAIPAWDMAAVLTEGAGCIEMESVVGGASCFEGVNESSRTNLL